MTSTKSPEEDPEQSDSTSVTDTNMRRRSMALILGIGSVISAGIAWWDTGWDGVTMTALLLTSGIALILYWKTGADPNGFGKPIRGEKKGHR